MIRLERTFDLDLVKRIQTDPDIYSWASDDYSPAPSDVRPSSDSRIWYVLAYDGPQLLGMLHYQPQSAVCWEVHCCLLRAAWGRSAEVATLSFRWIFAITSCRRIVATIPSYNRLTIALAKRAGMTQYGVNTAAFLKHGNLHDLVCFGISPPRV